MESLRVTVHLISHQTPGLLKVEGQALSLVDDVRVDLLQFLARLKNSACSISAPGDDTCLAWIQRADLLPGWYEDWVILEQSKLRDIS